MSEETVKKYKGKEVKALFDSVGYPGTLTLAEQKKIFWATIFNPKKIRKMAYNIERGMHLRAAFQYSFDKNYTHS